MPPQLKPSTSKTRDSKTTLTDLLPKLKDSKINSIDLTNASELNPPSPHKPQTNNRETNNFGIRPPHSATPSPTNTTMPPPPEDKNSNSFLNSKRWSRRDSVKSKTRTTKDNRESKKPSKPDFYY